MPSGVIWAAMYTRPTALRHKVFVPPTHAPASLAGTRSLVSPRRLKWILVDAVKSGLSSALSANRIRRVFSLSLGLQSDLVTQR